MARIPPRAPIALLFVAAASLSSPAHAAKHHFEPTDLELQDPGWLEADLQMGFAQSSGPARLVLPDAEINIGVSERVEIDLDFALGLEGAPDRRFSLDHLSRDNLWLASKIGLWDSVDDVAHTAWALGIQLGPKLPAAAGARGIGSEAHLLVGRTIRATHLVLNTGAVIDPGAEVSRKRPIGVELGLDLDQDLDKDGAFSLLAEVGGIHYFTGDPDALQATAGLQWSPSSYLDLSLSALAGLPPGSDRFAILLGVSPKLRLWK
ncbi:MAG: hypothetical protein U0359_35215 [Byssovorax sp.]